MPRQYRLPLLFLSLAFTGGVTVAIGLVLGGKMSRLEADGVTTTARVTRLREVSSGSGNSRTTNYRVWLDAEHNGQDYALEDDVAEDIYRPLAEGGSVSVVFVPDGSGLCLIGAQADVARVAQTAEWVRYGGAAVAAIGATLLAAVWFAPRLPSNDGSLSGQAYGRA
ncbi:hypothetical protein Pla123a_05070 [Posidoniimonas polymericola]|uniref:DUF3592 domain-containing protein n=1 Tax=Posidoniimonas polymericola TaxID=2528002 RepID=A0A5C5ZEY6_9BACT|nr:DUF3592 domain-containing protein [Posidoniimonas polymericola]TWT85700.1 hypothetical protein Pla123a_05070 [Posidoniimonas polymericola]